MLGGIEIFQIQLILHRWKKVDLLVAKIWGLKDRVSSKMTSRFLAVGKGEMAVSPMMMVKVAGRECFWSVKEGIRFYYHQV